MCPAEVKEATAYQVKCPNDEKAELLWMLKMYQSCKNQTDHVPGRFGFVFFFFFLVFTFFFFFFVVVFSAQLSLDQGTLRLVLKLNKNKVK